MFVAHFVFICSHFRMQGKLATDCDGSVKHRKWQEPAGTLLMALTAYSCTSRGFSLPLCSRTFVRTAKTVRTGTTLPDSSTIDHHQAYKINTALLLLFKCGAEKFPFLRHRSIFWFVCACYKSAPSPRGSTSPLTRSVRHNGH